MEVDNLVYPKWRVENAVIHVIIIGEWKRHEDNWNFTGSNLVIYVKVREIVKARSQSVEGTEFILKTFIINLFYKLKQILIF